MNLKANVAANERRFRRISYVLVFLMLVCIILAISSLIQNVVPSWASGVIAGVMLFIVLNRLYTFQRFKSLTPMSSEWLLTLGTQWIVILVFTRLLLSYARGLDAFVTEVSRFAHGYLIEIITPEFVVTGLLAILAWYLPTQFLELLDEMSMDQAMAAHEDLPMQNTVPAHRRLVNLVFSVGIFLVILTALAHINLRTIFFDPESPFIDTSSLSASEASSLLYFIFGLALLTQSRLMSLQTRWTLDRIPISSENLTGRWSRYSLFFLFFLILLVSLLPTGNSVGFSSLLGTLFFYLISVVLFLAQIVTSIVTILFSLPFLLLGKGAPLANRLPTIPRLPVTSVESPFPPSGSVILALIKSVLLWGSLAFIIFYSLMYFLRQHEELFVRLRKARIIHWLVYVWQWLRQNVTATWVDLSRAIAEGWQNIVARLETRRVLPRLNWINFRSLNPRQRVYFFYLAMIRRGSEQVLARKPSQTPSEYAAALAKDLPSAGEDIDAITQAFVEARYTQHEITAQDVQNVKGIWARIRQALQDQSKVAKP